MNQKLNIENTSLHHHLINNHDVAANEGKIKVQLPLEHLFGFCKTSKRFTKQLEFPLIFKTDVLQDIIYTTVGDNNKVIFVTLFLFVPMFIPDAQTEIMFKDSSKK